MSNPFVPLHVTGKGGAATAEDVNRVQDQVRAAFNQIKQGGVTKLTSQDGTVIISPKGGTGAVDLSVPSLSEDGGSTGTIELGATNAPLVTSSLPSKFLSIEIDGDTYIFPAWKKYKSTGGPPATGLLAWLKGDAGVTLSGGNVTAWVDQSGNGYDHTYIGSDPIGLETSPGINGIPALTFQLNYTALLNHATVPGGTAGSVLIIYQRLSTAQNYNRVYAFPNDANAFLSNNYLNNSGQFWYAWSATQYSTTVTEIIGALMTWAPGAFKAYFNRGGWSTPFEANTSTLSLSVGSAVGGQAGFGVAANAKISEVLRWDHDLDAAERLQLASYVATRYGI